VSAIADDVLAALRTDVVRIVRESTGLHERLAVPIAEDILLAMRRRWGGERLAVPAETAAERALSIRCLIAAGYPPEAVAQLTGVSRATVYRAMRR